MPSPFPGMDPYLEDPAVWRDFHGELIYACRGVLLDRLPPDYDATVEEQVRLFESSPAAEGDRPSITARDVYPDVAVSRLSSSGGPAAAGGAAAVLEPVTIRIPPEQEVRERWIEIRYRPDNTLLTSIEVLSPTNKNDDGRAEYRSKRRPLFRQKVSLVEVDLLLAGDRLESRRLLPPGDYYALVTRAAHPGLRDVYAWGLRRALPAVPVPLRPPDADVLLDLASAFATAFDRGCYSRRLRCSRPPPAPLPDGDRLLAENRCDLNGPAF